MRLFAGLDIASDIRVRIADYVQDLRLELPSPGDKWVREESLHVTLKFIGETRQVEEIKSCLTAVRSKPMQMAFRGVGFFTPRSPKIFYVGVESGIELSALAGDIDSILETIGIPRKTNEYRPHMTLARAGSGSPRGSQRINKSHAMHALRELVNAQPQPEFGTMTANELFLYRSETLPGGPRYTKLASYKLFSKPDA